MTHRSFFNEETFNPWIVDEEETDLYARNKDFHRIWAVPEKAYIHHNRQYFYKKFIRVFMLYSNIGYLQSLYNAISRGYLVNYISLQRKYLQSIIAGILLYTGLYFSSQLLLVFWLALCFVDLGFYFTGVIRNSVILPYKLFGLLIFLIVPHRTSVKENGKTFILKYPGLLPS